MAKKYLKVGIGLLSLATITGVGAFALTSCSGSINEYNEAKVLEMNPFQDVESHKTPINDALKQNANVSVYDLVKGTNSFNNGKYMFIYGSVGYTGVRLKNSAQDGQYNVNAEGEISSFYKWLIDAKDKVNDDEINQFQNFKIGNTFFANWFNDIKEISSPYKDVKIAMYIDIPPVTEDIGSKEGLEKLIKADPFATWSNDDVLWIYRWSCQKENNPTDITSFDELPINWKLLSGTYIRQDKGAEEYRKFVEYATDLRPGIASVSGGNNKESGMIAFNTTSRNPISYSLDKSSIVTDENVPLINPSTVGETWKNIYRLYNGKTWEEAFETEDNKESEG